MIGIEIQMIGMREIRRTARENEKTWETVCGRGVVGLRENRG